VRVDYNHREAIENLHARINAAAAPFGLGDYSVVARHGLIENRMTPDEYFLTPGESPRTRLQGHQHPPAGREP
jgi:hypothetical protein